MNTNDLPTPEYQGPGHYLCPAFDKYRRAKGVRYDVYLEEFGWRCYNPWCKNPWGCPHALRVPDYLFEQDIISILPDQRSAKAQPRVTLESLFDYSNPIPPTHRVTDRAQVAARR